MPPRQSCPGGHETLWHRRSTHTPESPSHAVPEAKMTSPLPQFSTQLPRKQTKPAGQRLLPSSITPSQLSSMALHFSSAGCCTGTHSSPPARHCIVPCAHIPLRPVSQAPPPCVHSMPPTCVSRSSKSSSALKAVSSQPK